MLLFLLVSLWGRCYNVHLALMKILKHREVIGPLKQSWDPDSGSPREEATLFNATLCAHTKDDKAHVLFPVFIFCYDLGGIQASILYIHWLVLFCFACLLLFIKHRLSNYNV